MKPEIRNRSRKLSVIAILVLLLTAVPVLAQPDHAGRDEALARLHAASNGKARVSLHRATGFARFVRVPGGLPDAALGTGRGASAEAKADAFLGRYGKAFGIADTARDLQQVGTRSGQILTHVSYAQVHGGVPVFGAVLRAHFDNGGNMTAVNGSFVPGLALDTTPAWSVRNARDVALAAVDGDGLSAGDPQLYVYRTGLVQGVAGRDHLVYEFEVLNERRTVREFVYVDAHFGKVIDRISGIHEALDRTISESSLANVVWTESDPDPIPAGWAGGSSQQVTDWQNEIDGARESYNVFASMTNGTFLSYDGAGATMKTVNNDPNINCPNANWNGTSTNYCSGVTGDDTVAHEWGHAYTEFTNNLIYQWQSGALNESYSDIWGEVVDFVNGRGSDSPGGLRDVNGSFCSSLGAGPKRRDNTYRWLSGEDDPAFNGAIRDMWRPQCYNDPGKVTDGEYWCTTGDAGGVHTNSGIPNHAFALLVDGGNYNGQSINGIGLTKTSRLHWEAQNLLTPSGNFVAHADALETACSALIGATLYELDAQNPVGVVSPEVVSAADCAEVTKVVTAVEFHTPPSSCNFQPMLTTPAPALCGGGTVTPVLAEDWEAGIGTWSVGTRAVANAATFDTPDWAVVGSLPDRAGSAAFVQDAVIGNCADDTEAGALFLDSPVIAIPAGSTTTGVAFDHWVATEATWDGGNVKVSVNGGAYSLVPGSAYDFNGYNSSLETVANGNDNPLAGEAAFTGSDGGAVSGSWGQSQIDLAGIAGAGDNVQVRFELGVDGCNGLIGWYVDDFSLHTCSGGGGGCDNDGVCEAGEDCGNCANDCDGQLGGKPSGRFCCGDGEQQGPETSALCDGNF